MLSNSCFAKISLVVAGAMISAASLALTSDVWRAEVPAAQSVGEGELHWFGFRIYRATLWSSHVPFDSNSTFALQLTYFRHISHERFVATSIDEIQRINSRHGRTISAQTLHKWQAYLSNAFPDVNEGDQLIGVFIPGTGCRFYSQSRLLADIPDPEFAQAFFAIWLDPDTREPSLREKLMGQSQ